MSQMWPQASSEVIQQMKPLEKAIEDDESS